MRFFHSHISNLNIWCYKIFSHKQYTPNPHFQADLFLSNIFKIADPVSFPETIREGTVDAGNLVPDFRADILSRLSIVPN
jgi:hypothetical protein